MEAEFINLFNTSLMEGKPTPSYKKGELIPRIAAAIHTLELCFQLASAKRVVHALDEEIGIDVMKKAVILVAGLQDQKDVFNSVSVRKKFKRGHTQCKTM